MVHLVTFELVGVRMPNEHVRLERAIKEIGPSFAFAPTTWIVESELTNAQIGERLGVFLRPTDRLVAVRIHRDWFAANIPQAEADWLASRNFSATADDPGSPRRIPTIRE